jgi:hypothetical protein
MFDILSPCRYIVWLSVCLLSLCFISLSMYSSVFASGLLVIYCSASMLSNQLLFFLLWLIWETTFVKNLIHINRLFLFCQGAITGSNFTTIVRYQYTVEPLYVKAITGSNRTIIGYQYRLIPLYINIKIDELFEFELTKILIYTRYAKIITFTKGLNSNLGVKKISFKSCILHYGEECYMLYLFLFCLF